ncbi:serine protease FAM111A-like isoform X2 [Thunnus albacares]|uniref:serine protease FAM111A-like isoform X2 n=1 Tax=Thunnus albacares TaxID=8236 RepID=UPI001CF6BB47|nr:serine protease FAM111A-like isoform X2 [Thunnus albacares]
MGFKLKPKNDGPMDKFVKKMTGDQNGESTPPPKLQVKKMTGNQNGDRSQPPKLQADKLQVKEVEPHGTHSFDWCWSDKKPTTITCDKAGTVEDVLKRSSQFREIAEKNKNKELVIVRDGKAISSHFPCRLIKKKRLTVRYVKANNKAKQLASGSGLPQRKRPSGELVRFHVLTKGGKTVMKLMRNPALQKEIQEITVYAYKGEKVKQALERDGRFLETIFTKNCALSHTSTEVNTEMSNLVDDLDGKTFKIILLNKSSPPESQPGSLDDAYMVQNESPRSDSDENQDPQQQSITTESMNDNKPKEKPELNDVVVTFKTIHEIPNSKTMRCNLSSQFKDVVNSMNMKSERVSKRSRIQNLFHVEYGKNALTCNEVKTMKKLMQLSCSVCQVRINGMPAGSGFLLFDKFVLTNGHVVKDICNESTGQLVQRVTVHFSFESLDQMEGEQESGANVVEEMVGGQYCCDVSGHKHDWALLSLCADQTLPDGLLPHFGFLPQSGGICIIGHPDGGVKRIDPCVIVSSDKRSQTVERHYHENPGGVLVENSYYSESQETIQMVTRNFFENVAESVKHNRQVLTYETCFYFGSSGSPVFDKYCHVVAMHTGGFHYHSPRGELKSVIEYGHPLFIIMEQIIVQMVERGRLDVLKAYLACDYDQHQNMMTNVKKKLVESRNLTAFKNAVNNSAVAGDEKLKTFFEFFCQTEDPVPMDTDSN